MLCLQNLPPPPTCFSRASLCGGTSYHEEKPHLRNPKAAHLVGHGIFGGALGLLYSTQRDSLQSCLGWALQGYSPRKSKHLLLWSWPLRPTKPKSMTERLFHSEPPFSGSWTTHEQVNLPGAQCEPSVADMLENHKAVVLCHDSRQ